MKFLLDENVEFRLALFLRDQGHDVRTIARDYPGALADAEVLAIAVHERRVLVTNDRDFGELVFRQGHPHAGVIYFRLPLGTDASVRLARLREILADHAAPLDQFLVVTPRGLRIRRQNHGRAGSTPSSTSTPGSHTEPG